jgi:hypothetical protein
LARHITLPLFMSTKRSRVITIAAAGTLTLATAISLAATLPSGSAPAPASANAAYMIAISRQATAQTARPAAASAQVANFSRIRVVQAKHQQELAAAERKAAAAKAAVRKAAARKAAEQAAQQPPVQAAAAQTTPQAQPVQQSAVTAPSGAPEQIAQQMLSQFGWSSSQFSCLQPLWQQESGWSVTAENPTSGAYGIAQALPGSKMASAGADWQTDAATQIRWGLGYIQGQYGSPCGAWAHEEATGWY